MKRVFIVLLSIILFESYSVASEISDSDIKIILSGMEIISLDTPDNELVTRENLAEILVKASKDAKLGKATIRLSTFPDVLYTDEKASYIRVAALNGYLTAYSDGEFKPGNIVKKEEAVTAILKLLGYKSDDFIGSYPYAQLTIANRLEITDGVDMTIGTSITQKDLQRLIYNMINCTVKDSNQRYAQTLGYSISDEITLGDIMNKNIDGPLTYKPNSTILGLTGLGNPIVYIDGKLSKMEDISYYDILYYSESSNIIWAYTDKITGILENISPNKEAPTEITVSGKSYKLSAYTSKKAFSIGGLEIGNMVTLLLDRNGEASDVYLTEELYAEQHGVIISTGKKDLMTVSGDKHSSYYATVLLVTGETIDIPTSTNYSQKVGYTAKISYKNRKVSIYGTRKVTDIYGKFNLSSKTLGKEKISEDISVLEVDGFWNVIKVYPSRLDGIYFEKEKILLVSKNDSGVIETMIIKDVTGDTAKYGILTGINESRDSESYTYIIDGNEKTYSNPDVTFSIKTGPVQIYMDGQNIGKMKNLEKFTGGIVNINNSYVENTKGDKMAVSPEVEVYYKDSFNYYVYSMDDAMSGEYNVSAYYDEDGKIVRLIIIS